MQLDLPLLTKEHEKKPGDTRIVFYLAQTLDLIEELPAALDMYQRRIDMGGWQQEVFEAHMRRVRCWQAANTPPLQRAQPLCCDTSCSVCPCQRGGRYSL